MRIIKYIGALLGIVVLLFLIVVNFSVMPTNYECKGVIEYKEIKQPLTVYIALNEYRWWVNLWNESDGQLYLEFPNQFIWYYNDLNEVGKIYFIHDLKMKGSFSTLSNLLALDTPKGFFDGTCKVIQ